MLSIRLATSEVYLLAWTKSGSQFDSTKPISWRTIESLRTDDMLASWRLGRAEKGSTAAAHFAENMVIGPVVPSRLLAPAPSLATSLWCHDGISGRKPLL